MSQLTRTCFLILAGILIASILAACGTSQTTTSVATTALPTEASNPTEAATSPTTEVPATGNTTPNIVAAANAFLATLSDTEKDAVLFDWSDTEQKQRWSNLPQGAFQRTGLMWGDMSEAQQNAWLQLMQATLSAEGYNRVIAEWNADEVLTTQGSGGGQLTFGSQYYWIAIIGTPSETDPWQWQWGGHHVTVNATIVGPNLSLTPSFIGVQQLS